MPKNGILAVKPANMTFEEASIIPYGAVMALSILKKIKIQKRQNFLIVGASGGIGTAMVQIAKHHYMTEVTGVCSTQRVKFVEKLGADKVIDYKKDDFPQSTESYDFIIDILGKGSLASYKPMLKINGKILYVSFKSRKLLNMIGTSFSNKLKVVCTIASPKKDDLIEINKLIQKGKIKSIIDKSFTLNAAAEAHRYAESGEKSGDIVIVIKK